MPDKVFPTFLLEKPKRDLIIQIVACEFLQKMLRFSRKF